jgi:hypothetical protein
MIALKKKPKQQNAVRILARSTERKTEDVLGDDQYWFRRGTGTRDAVGIKVSPVTGHESPVWE